MVGYLLFVHILLVCVISSYSGLNNKTISLVPGIDMIIDNACSIGDLILSERLISAIKYKDASLLHMQSALAYILHANNSLAVSLHKEAKLLNSTLIPPLAALNVIHKLDCGGLSDIFYVAAVIIKKLVDTNLSVDSVLDGHKTMITLCSDSGLSYAAEAHLLQALSVSPSLDMSLFMRSTVMTPAIYDGTKHIKQVRTLLASRINALLYIMSRIKGNNITHMKQLTDYISETIPTTYNRNVAAAMLSYFDVKGDNSKIILKLDNLDEFSLSPTFYYVYMGYDDKELMSSLHQLYSHTHQQMGNVEGKLLSTTATDDATKSSTGKIKVGFVSAHFRKHSICKLYCGIIMGIDKEIFDVYVFAAMSERNHDVHTNMLIDNISRERFVSLGMTLLSNRYEVLDRNIDILVYLDVGMTPSTPMWSTARLAPVQMVTWGHPVTTGMKNMDYFISSDTYHNNIYQQQQLQQQQRNYSFSEQVVHLDSLGFYFNLPALDIPELGSVKHESSSTVSVTTNGVVDAVVEEDTYYTIKELMSLRPPVYYHTILHSKVVNGSNSEINRFFHTIINKKLYNSTKIVLCPQFLPKIHPAFDNVFKHVLKAIPNAIIVVLGNSKKNQWQRVLNVRWKRTVGLKQINRLLWVNALTPTEYLALLSIGDLMLDPFPFGGGVTSLEALSVCTPVITAPYEQSVPALTFGMISKMKLYYHDMLVATNRADYIEKSIALLGDKGKNVSTLLYDVRTEICNNAHILYNQNDSIIEYDKMLVNIYNSNKI